MHAAEIGIPAAIAGAEFGEHRENAKHEKHDKEEKKEQKKALDEARKQAKEDAAEQRKQQKEDAKAANLANVGNGGHIPVGVPPGSVVAPPGTLVPLGAPTTGAANVGNAPAHSTGTVPILEEITLPDGRKAYVQRADHVAPEPTGKGNKLSKSKPDKTSTDADDPNGPGGAVVTTHGIGKMHCPMCCPSAPRDALGRPLYHCVHQIDSPGPGPMGAAKPASMTGKGKKPTPTPDAIPLPTGEEPVEEPAKGGAKLRKGKAAAPSPEDEMEDARKLASESALEYS